MAEILDILQQEWAFRALLASSLVGIMCGLLGCFIVLRNMSLIGDALSHAILPGVVFAFMILGYSALGFFVGSVIAGLLTALIITWIQQNVGTKNDAAVGIVFTAMFSIGVMGISWISQNEGVHLDLKDFLFGNVLGVSDQDLVLTSAVAIYVLLSIIVFYRYLFVTTFQPVIAQTMGISVKIIHYFLMLLLSFAVVASLQTVGVILVVAMLITPASTALLLSDRLEWVLVISALIGFGAAVFGLLGAIVFETTPGPAMAVVATLLYVLAVFFAPSKGVLFRSLRQRSMRHRIQLEDFLKQSYRLAQEGSLNVHQLEKKLGLSSYRIKRHLKESRRKGWFENNDFSLTAKGKEQAKRLVRAHRLWETYQVNKMGLSAEQIHEEAEHYEHHLTDDLLEEVDKVLGFPAFDPHGSPIPARMALPDSPLARVKEQNLGAISPKQLNEHVTAFLWEKQLLPGTQFTLLERTPDHVVIELSGLCIQLPMNQALQINVDIET